MGSLSDILSMMVVISVLATSNPITADADAPSPTSSTSSSSRKVTELVDKVCNKTSNYKNCVDTLYGDPRTPDADRYTLAYISFGLAYLNAKHTRDRIAHLLLLLNNSTTSDRLNLLICQRDYRKAIKHIQSAFNDLNSETFFTLPRYANHTASVAHDCQSHYPPISSANLNTICAICTVIAKLFTGGE